MKIDVNKDYYFKFHKSDTRFSYLIEMFIFSQAVMIRQNGVTSHTKII
jgi:hypothetical protein